jgi:hypothetical protein
MLKKRAYFRKKKKRIKYIEMFEEPLFQ